MDKKTLLIFTVIIVTVLGFAGTQYQQNKQLKSYLNKQLNEKFNTMNNQVRTLDFVTGNAVKDKEIGRISLNEIKEVLSTIQIKSIELREMAKAIQPDEAVGLEGTTYNTTRFMETRLEILSDRIDSRDTLALEGDSLEIIKSINKTSSQWLKESDSFLGEEQHINDKDWIHRLLEMQKHSERYQRVMDGSQ